MEAQKIIETLQSIFIGADQHNWDQILNAFAEKVHLDYTSLSGGEAEDLPATTIVNNWKNFLPRFKATHHQLGNFMIKEDGSTAKAFFYGTATHYFPNPSGRHIWTVTGTYDARLEKHGEVWRVNYLRLNLHYVDGNTDLPNLVMG